MQANKQQEIEKKHKSI